MKDACSLEIRETVQTLNSTIYSGGTRRKVKWFILNTKAHISCDDVSCELGWKQHFDGSSAARAATLGVTKYEPGGLVEVKDYGVPRMSLAALYRTGQIRRIGDVYNERSRSLEDYKVTDADVIKIYEDFDLIDKPWPPRWDSRRQMLRLLAELERRFPHKPRYYEAAE